MKNALKYANFASLGLMVIAFILALATPGAVYNGDYLSSSVAGGVCIFGSDYATGTWAGVLVFIFSILVILALAATIILPLLKINTLDAYMVCIYGGVALLALLTGIFAFCVGGAFNAANTGLTVYSTGAGWVISGILSILSAICAACPVVTKLLNK